MIDILFFCDLVNINVERIERTKFRLRHNKSYIDQASLVRVVEVWPRPNAKRKKNWRESSYLDLTLGQ